MKFQLKADKITWTGRIITILIGMPFLMSAMMKFMGAQQVLEGMNHLGWPDSLIFTVATLEAVSVILYLIPQTSTLGAILLTGYLGGAISTHLRINESVILQALFGVLIWGGLYLREPRLRTILPLRM